MVLFPFLFLKKHSKTHQCVPVTRGSTWRKRADPCKTTVALVLYLQIRHVEGQQSTFSLTQSKWKERSWWRRKEPGASFLYLSKQLICKLEVSWCSHSKALLTWAVSHILNINMVAESEGLSSKKCQMLPDAAGTPAFVQQRGRKVHVLPLAWLFLRAFTIICHWNQSEFCTEGVTMVAAWSVHVFCCPAGLSHKQGAGSWQPLEVLPRTEWELSKWTKWFITEITQRGVT